MTDHDVVSEIAEVTGWAPQALFRLTHTAETSDAVEALAPANTQTVAVQTQHAGQCAFSESEMATIVDQMTADAQEQAQRRRGCHLHQRSGQL